MPETRFYWRHQYDDLRDESEREQTDITPVGASLTQQHFKEDADINTIMRRFGVTDGSIPPVALDPRYFGDFTDATDFRTALDRVREAEQRFALLPADLRNRFANDPAALYAFVTDPANEKEAIQLKLLADLNVKPEAAAPVAAATTTPAA